MNTSNAISRNIYAIRTHFGYTQQTFADLLGVSQVTVSKWETSGHKISESNIKRITDALPVTYDEVVGDESGYAMKLMRMVHRSDGYLTDNEIKDIFVSNLKGIMADRDIDGPTIAHMIGAEKQSIYSWLNKNSFPSANNLQKLIDALHVSSDDLLARKKVASGYTEVPVLASIAAGQPIDLEEVDDTFFVPSKLANRYPNAFLYRVEGDSMNRRIPDGCLALVDKSDREPDGHSAYAVCVNGYSATIKRVKRLANGYELTPDSYDPTQRPLIFDYGKPGTDEVTIIGKVVWATMPFDYSI